MKPYRPSNGTEGLLFAESWCDRCVRDADMRRDPENGAGCPILAATMAFNIGDPNYPREWVEDDGGPRCTAYQLEAGA